MRTNAELLEDLHSMSFLPKAFFKHDTSFNGILLDSGFLAAAIQQCVGHFTFQEAFDRTGRILNVRPSENQQNKTNKK